MPLITQGAALDSITFTPKSASSVLDIAWVLKGNPTATDCFTALLFNGSTYVDQQPWFLSAGSQVNSCMELRTTMPSPGTVPTTLNLRVGANSGNTWRQGQVNNGSASVDNTFMKSWVTVRESTFG